MTFQSTTNTNPPKFISNTIDEKHTEMLQHFERIETLTIPALLQEKKKLIQMISQLKECQIDQYLDIRDKVLEIKKKIGELKKEKKNYFLDNSKYIFDYFEQKQQISNSNITSSGDALHTVSKNATVLNSFFKIKSTKPEAENLTSEKYALSKKAYQYYWQNVNNEIMNIQDFVISSDICIFCKKGEMIPQDEEGILICNNQACGKFVTYIVDSSKPTNKEPPNEVSYTAYIRLNHFKEILSQFQAKETTQIPEEVINNIKARITRERIKDMSQLNYDKMREILRKLGYNKYFEHIQYINSLFGIKPPIMDDQLHETLCVLFIAIQQPYALYCPAGRTNFFNYAYILHQLLVLLDQTQYIPFISLLKDDTKQREQDAIWKDVCKFLDWQFIPSI